MHRSFLVASAALLACLVVVPAQAQWVWKDGTGRTHASDRPPPADVPERNITQRPNTPRAAAPGASVPSAAAASSPVAEPRNRVDPELEARRKRAEQEQNAQRKAEEERQAGLRVENCNRAREALRQLESGMRIARVNAKGEREVLDDQARAAEVQRARDIAASDCR